MLPVLTARESITEANRHAVGSGMLNEEARREITRTWQNAAGESNGKRGKAVRPHPNQLASVGIRVMRVPVRKVATDG